MEYYFENQFTITKEYYKEFYRYICFKKPIMLSVNIILMINFVLSLTSIIFPKLNIIDNYTAQANIASVFIILCIEFYVYYRNVDLAYKKHMEINKGNIENFKIILTENNISIISSLDKKDFDIKNVQKVIKTKNYYFLISKAKFMIGVKKDSFTNGEEQDFIKFIKEKIK